MTKCPGTPRRDGEREREPEMDGILSYRLCIVLKVSPYLPLTFQLYVYML
jgi:hypothetical protein